MHECRSVNEGHPDKLCDQVLVQMTASSRLHSCMLQSPMQLATKSKRSTEHVVDDQWHGEQRALLPLACIMMHMARYDQSTSMLVANRR